MKTMLAKLLHVRIVAVLWLFVAVPLCANAVVVVFSDGFENLCPAPGMCSNPFDLSIQPRFVDTTEWRAFERRKSLEVRGGPEFTFGNIFYPGVKHEIVFELTGNPLGPRYKYLTMCIDFDKGTGCGYWKFDTFNSTAADPGWTEVSWLIDGPYAPPGYPSLVQIGQVYFTGWSSDPAAGIDSTFVFGPAIDNFRIIAFVPEPSSLALLGIALAAFGARWRRSALRQLA